MTDDLKHINDEINTRGAIDYRVDSSGYKGEYREMIESLNTFIEVLITDVAEIFKTLTEVGDGSFNVEIKQLPGKKAVFSDQIKLLTTSLREVHTEVVTLAKEASSGKLDAQANSAAFKGDWAKLMEDLNGLLTTLAQKAFWYESLLDSIPFPVSVTDMNMKWTFINKATEGILGKSRTEVAGQPCSNWGAGICNTENCGIKCTKRGKSQTTFEQGGLSFQVDINALKDIQGKNIGYIEVVQDITGMQSMIQQQKKVMEEVKVVSEQLSIGYQANFRNQSGSCTGSDAASQRDSRA